MRSSAGAAFAFVAAMTTGCVSSSSHTMGDLQVEILDRPAALSQSLVAWCGSSRPGAANFRSMVGMLPSGITVYVHK